MSLADIPITAVGHLERAGTSRSGHEIAAIVVVADERPAVIAVADYQHAATSLLPHFYLARDGTLAQLLTINRAGDGLGRAIWRGRMRNLNRIAVIVSVEAPNVTDLSEVQASVLADWLPALVAQSTFHSPMYVRLFLMTQGGSVSNRISHLRRRFGRSPVMWY